MGEPAGWQLSGNAPEAYEQYIIPAFIGEWAQDLVQTAARQAGERILDLACGMGVVARSAAPVVGPTSQVVGIDVNIQRCQGCTEPSKALCSGARPLRAAHTKLSPRKHT